MRHTGPVSEPSDLGAYLRARREALRPADVGLVDNGRRRTPGLRREEVAALAGVSIDYLTRLEQGRDTNPSASVLAALSVALRLGDGERTHLAKLAALEQSHELCPTATPLADDISPGVRHLLDQLDSTPAFVVGGIGDVVAWNAPWERLVAQLGMLDDPRVNLARYVFTHPASRAVYVDWDAAADEQVARLRASEPRWREEPRSPRCSTSCSRSTSSRRGGRPIPSPRNDGARSSSPTRPPARCASRSKCWSSPTTRSTS